MTDQRPDMQAIEFKAALATRDDHRIVIALFDGAFSECVAILKCSEESARALIGAVSSALSTDTS
jgi:hypothetical protein